MTLRACRPRSRRRPTRDSAKVPRVFDAETKVIATDAYEKASILLHESAGPDGLLQFDVPSAAADGCIEYDAHHSAVTTIYGGMRQVIGNTFAERQKGTR